MMAYLAPMFLACTHYQDPLQAKVSLFGPTAKPPEDHHLEVMLTLNSCGAKASIVCTKDAS